MVGLKINSLTRTISKWEESEIQKVTLEALDRLNSYKAINEENP